MNANRKILAKMTHIRPAISFLSLFAGVLAILVSSCSPAPSDAELREQKIDSLLSQMTLDEKIGQMTQIRHFDEFTDEDLTSGGVGSIIHRRTNTGQRSKGMASAFY